MAQNLEVHLPVAAPVRDYKKSDDRQDGCVSVEMGAGAAQKEVQVPFVLTSQERALEP